MEAFFPEPLRYWVAESSVTQIATTHAWPPAIAVIGNTPCIRGWNPKGKFTSAEFEPVTSLCELDGTRKTSIVVHGPLLAVGDSSPAGLVTLWDTAAWERKETFEAGAPVTVLLLNAEFLAAGTTQGRVRVWRRSTGGGWQVLLKDDLRVEPEGRPCLTLCLGEAPDGSGLLVGHSAATSRISVWRLSDGQLLQTLGCVVTAANAESLVVGTNVQFAFMDGRMLTMLSWLHGHDPCIQVLDVLARQAHDLDAPDRLAGRGKPTSADFRGGRLLAVGFEDGAVAAFGYHGWLRFHGGAVGAVRVLPERMQVASGGADGCVRLWSGEGVLMACVHVGFQVTALTGGDVYLAAGGARGELQLLVLASEEELKSRGGPSKEEVEAAAVKPAGRVEQYTLYFDSRPAKPAGPSGTAKQGRVADHPEAFHAFAGPPRRPVSAAELLSIAGSSSGGGPQASGTGDAASEAGRTSSVNGTSGSAHVVGDEEAAKRKQQLAAMGEDRGVARTAGTVSLESNTTRVGRKCDSNSCLAREGLGGAVFKRCGACRSVWYCSVHCQRTHYRDRHSKECAVLADLWRKGQEEAKQEQQQKQQQQAEAARQQQQQVALEQAVAQQQQQEKQVLPEQNEALGQQQEQQQQMAEQDVVKQQRQQQQHSGGEVAAQQVDVMATQHQGHATPEGQGKEQQQHQQQGAPGDNAAEQQQHGVSDSSSAAGAAVFHGSSSTCALDDVSQLGVSLQTAAVMEGDLYDID